MYIFAQHGILSIVAHRTKPSMLMVRAVVGQDLKHYWPNAKIIEMADSDYRSRIVLPRDTVAARIAQAITVIDYDKVKPAVSADRQEAYMSAWGIMMGLQESGRPI